VSLGLEPAPALAACDDPPAIGGQRPRWAYWRSPAGQPAWARPALLGIAAAAAALFAWNITSAGLAPFYSTAVKSMSVSWKAFFFGALDPKATITIDKLAGSFLPQALSARIFGFHPWSLALPQVIEGVIAVLVMYRMVRRWAGVVPGLLAAGLLAFTPIAASMFGHSMEDGALTMCLVLAADSWQRAVMTGRLRSLMWSGVWVGLGFQAKMLQAWMILPALGIGYLLCAPGPLRRRLGQLAGAGAVMLAVSLSWIALYTFTPASSRPFVDGSTSNSALAMVFGYNGVERFGVSFPGAVTSGPGVTTGGSRFGGRGFPGRFAEGGFPPGGFPGGGTGGAASAAGGSGAAAGAGTAAGGSGTTAGAGTAAGGPGTGAAAIPGAAGAAGSRLAGPGGAEVGNGGFLDSAGGWVKLIGSRFGPEIAWLFPFALFTLILGLAWRRRAGRTDPVRAGLVMWGAWLLTYAIVYSAMSNIPHTAYMASLAPALAALSAAGIVMCWRWYRAGGGRAWAMPAAVAVTVAWAMYLWSYYPGFLPWARWATLAGGVAAVAGLVIARVSRQATGRLAMAGLAVGAAAIVAAPVTWASSVLDAKYAGSSFDASAGPSGGFGAGPGGNARLAAGEFRRAFGGATGTGSGSVAAAEAQRLRELLPGIGGTAGRGRIGGIGASATTTLSASEQRLYRYLTAHRQGASYLMAVSSWSSASPYILATGQEVLPMGGFSGSVPEPTLAQVQQLVRSGQLRFFLLGGGGFGGGGFGGAGGTSTTQRIATWVRSTCTTVPAKDYGGTAAVTGTGLGAPGGVGGADDAAASALYVCGTKA
jgi:4-amino-4-deoxy-L-arabinose transferase-like glycosyltransferase